jgi:hypothetical protein
MMKVDQLTKYDIEKEQVRDHERKCKIEEGAEE